MRLRLTIRPFVIKGEDIKQEKSIENDLKKIRPMIEKMFDFEKKIAEKMHISCDKLVGSGSYLYLRSGLIERWNKLNEFDTYPNMIEPLKDCTHALATEGPQSMPWNLFLPP